MELKSALALGFRFGPPFLCGGRQPCSRCGAHLSALFWLGFCVCGPRFSPPGGNSNARGFGTRHFSCARRFIGSGRLAAPSNCFDLALKRLDLFLYQNQFSQLFNSQVLQWCHIIREGCFATGLTVKSRSPLQRLGLAPAQAPRASPDASGWDSPISLTNDSRTIRAGWVPTLFCGLAPGPLPAAGAGSNAAAWPTGRPQDRPDPALSPMRRSSSWRWCWQRSWRNSARCSASCPSQGEHSSCIWHGIVSAQWVWTWEIWLSAPKSWFKGILTNLLNPPPISNSLRSGSCATPAPAFG